MLLNVLANQGTAKQRDFAAPHITQGFDLYRASQLAQDVASRPLLLYYSIMQVVKAFCYAYRGVPTAPGFKHGLSDKHRTGQDDPFKADKITPQVSDSKSRSIFADFLSELGGVLPMCVKSGATKAEPEPFQVLDVLGQIVIGSRALYQARRQRERFIQIERIAFMHDSSKKEVWMKAYIRSGDLSRLHYTAADLMAAANVSGSWTVAAYDRLYENGPTYAVLEHKAAKYATIPSESLDGLVRSARPAIWQTAIHGKPYHRHYLFMPPSGGVVLPQLASMFMGIFHFGSVTRYHPNDFRAFLSGRYGHYVGQFIETQAIQMLYLLTSEWARQDVVTEPAISA